MGGLSSERDVSLRSGQACLRPCKQKGYVAVRIDVQKDVAGPARQGGRRVAFNALHGRGGEDGCIQGLLESMFIPYTGSLRPRLGAGHGQESRPAGLRRARIPHAARRWSSPPAPRWERAGFRAALRLPRRWSSPSARAARSACPSSRTRRPCGGPRARPASSRGALLVEKYVKGREIPGGGPRRRGAGPIRKIVPRQRVLYDYDAKYQAKTTRYLFPAPYPADLYQRACTSRWPRTRRWAARARRARTSSSEPDGSLWILRSTRCPA
jgi:D-alanine-D-alanine ligase